MLKEAIAIHEAAADAVEALAHLGLLATATGHSIFAESVHLSLKMLLSAPEARRIVPAEYLDVESIEQ